MISTQTQTVHHPLLCSPRPSGPSVSYGESPSPCCPRPPPRPRAGSCGECCRWVPGPRLSPSHIQTATAGAAGKYLHLVNKENISKMKWKKKTVDRRPTRLTVESLNLQHRNERGEDFGFGPFHHLLVSLQDALQDEGEGGQDVRSCCDHTGDTNREV